MFKSKNRNLHRLTNLHLRFSVFVFDVYLLASNIDIFRCCCCCFVLIYHLFWLENCAQINERFRCINTTTKLVPEDESQPKVTTKSTSIHLTVYSVCLGVCLFVQCTCSSLVLSFKRHFVVIVHDNFFFFFLQQTESWCICQFWIWTFVVPFFEFDSFIICVGRSTMRVDLIPFSFKAFSSASV